jgi:hypothetical protein
MAMALALGLAACATLGGGSDPETRKVFAGMRGCGLDTRSAWLSYSPADALVILSTPRLPAAVKETCLARLFIDRGIELKSSDLAFAQRFGEALQREYDLLGPRKARFWLKRNRKGKVPDFAPTRESLGTYVRKLEKICDAPAGSVGTDDGRVLVPWLEGEANNQVSCVYLAALASNLGANGIKVVSLPDKLPAAN